MTLISSYCSGSKANSMVHLGFAHKSSSHFFLKTANASLRATKSLQSAAKTDLTPTAILLNEEVWVRRNLSSGGGVGASWGGDAAHEEAWGEIQNMQWKFLSWRNKIKVGEIGVRLIAETKSTREGKNKGFNIGGSHYTFTSKKSHDSEKLTPFHWPSTYLNRFRNAFNFRVMGRRLFARMIPPLLFRDALK